MYHTKIRLTSSVLLLYWVIRHTGFTNSTFTLSTPLFEYITLCVLQQQRSWCHADCQALVGKNNPEWSHTLFSCAAVLALPSVIVARSRPSQLKSALQTHLCDNRLSLKSDKTLRETTNKPITYEDECIYIYQHWQIFCTLITLKFWAKHVFRTNKIVNMWFYLVGQNEDSLQFQAIYIYIV